MRSHSDAHRSILTPRLQTRTRKKRDTVTGAHRYGKPEISAHAFTEHTTRSHCQYLRKNDDRRRAGEKKSTRDRRAHRQKEWRLLTWSGVRVISRCQMELTFPSTLHPTFNDIVSRKQAASFSENR
ncbi:hypothetical protein ILYODFUR_024961 [Ilyodon furcidens]|uniref:Uncharacterized protein n=1 Tax=Ilyodon furcidens TaxID=33524 RepID=A0ABV0V6K8_9TELE